MHRCAGKGHSSIDYGSRANYLRAAMKHTGSENAPLVESTGSSAARSLDLRDSVFICYAHEDQKWCDWFRKRLSSDQSVRVWTDHDIEEGAHWHEMIQEKIRSARIALFLVSPSFVNSHYLATTEFPQIIIQRARWWACGQVG